jgi:hypothetical protein
MVIFLINHPKNDVTASITAETSWSVRAGWTGRLRTSAIKRSALGQFAFRLDMGG